MSRLGVVLASVAILIAALPAAEARHLPANAPAMLIGGHEDRPADTDRDGRADQLQVDVPVRVVTAGSYSVTAKLATEDGRESLTFNVTSTLAVGDRMVRVAVPGAYVANLGYDGTLILKTTLRKAASGTDLDTYDYRLAAYQSAGFQAPLAGLTKPSELYFEDTDANGRADALVVDAFVNAREGIEVTMSVCLKEARTSRDLGCLPDANAFAPKGGSVHPIRIPASFVGSTYTGEYAVATHLHVGTAYLDSKRATSAPFRLPALSAPETTLAAPDVGPQSGTSVPVAGLAAKANVEVGDSRLLELHVRVAEARAGLATSVKTPPTRLPAGGGNLSVAIAAAEATRVLQGARAPVLYYALYDASGLVVNGGRVILPDTPDASPAFSPSRPIPGKPVTFLHADLGEHGVPEKSEWTFGDGGTALGPEVTHVYESYRAYDVTLRVFNAWGLSSEAKMKVTVEPDSPPVIASDSPLTWRTKELVERTFVVPVEDPNGQPVTLSVVNAPRGVVTEGTKIRWTPPSDSPREVTLRMLASDGMLTTPFTVTASVDNSDAPPEVRVNGAPAPESLSARAGEAFSVAVTGFDLDEDPVAITLDKAPRGMTLADGMLTWSAPEEGTHEAQLTAKAGRLSTVALISIVVAPADAPEPPTEEPTVPPPTVDTSGGPPKEGLPGPGAVAALVALALVAVAARRRK